MTFSIRFHLGNIFRSGREAECIISRTVNSYYVESAGVVGRDSSVPNLCPTGIYVRWSTRAVAKAVAVGFHALSGSFVRLCCLFVAQEFLVFGNLRHVNCRVG